MKKKVLFLQIKGNSLGGIWSVNKTLGEKLLELGYGVEILGIRNNHPGMDNINTKLDIKVINKKDNWEITRKKDIIKSLKHFSFFRTLIRYIKEHFKLKSDLNKAKQEIYRYDPDYIITSHYHTLLAVPKEYLKRTINLQHSSFEYVLKDRYNVKVLKKYDQKVFKLAWLNKTILNQASNYGFRNNTYIYNPCQFEKDKKADVVKNKKICVITRMHPEKRIDLMIKIVNDVFKDSKFNDWTFDIYGVGSLNDESQNIIKNSKQISFCGSTDSPQDILLKSSLSLNTSLFEGFSISILESFDCGLPVISFKYGEGVAEQIKDGFNGFVVPMDDIDEYKNKLIELLSNEKKLKNMSDNAKKFSYQFKTDSVIKNWIKLFNEIDNNS